MLVISLEPNAYCHSQLVEKTRSLGNVTVHNITAEVLDRHIAADYQADTVVCMNVLEHVENDLLALKHMQHVLVPGGKAILLLPAFDALYGPIDRNLGHFRRYSKRSWIDTAEQAGFSVSRVRYFKRAVPSGEPGLASARSSQRSTA